MPPQENDKAKEIIKAGAEIAGKAVGGALGFLAAGPLGAAGAGAAGGAVSVVIAKGAILLLGDIAHRHISHREVERIGATAAMALDAIQKKNYAR